jgi:hypothetical protein
MSQLSLMMPPVLNGQLSAPMNIMRLKMKMAK